MSIFGLSTRRETDLLRQELAALKAERHKYEQWQLDTAQAEKWTMPDPSVYGNQADLYRTVSWVMSAVDITAFTAALTPFRVMEAKPDQEPKDIVNHDFEALLRIPNPEDSRSEFFYSTVAFYKMTGNAYWWLNRKDENSPPVEMWIIPPHMIDPCPDGRMYLDGYDYSPGDGGTIHLETWEIVPFRRFNPFSRFRGLSAIESLALAATGDKSMAEYNSKLFNEKGGSPPGIFLFEQMIEDDQWKKIKADRREAAQKREDMMLRGVGDVGGVKWQQNAISQRDMEFLEGRKFNKSEIFSGLAPGLESMTDPSATEANANAGERTFMAKCIYPLHVMMAEKITASILPVYGENLVGKFDDVRISDRQLALQEMSEYAKTHTVAEIRRKYYQDDPLGDERDDLFPAQVNAQTGQPEPPAPVIMQSEPKPETIRGQEPLEEADEAEAENNALKAELEKWRRKAIKKIGQAVPFESDVIPPEINAAILSALPACKTAENVRALFAGHLHTSAHVNEIAALARAIERAVESITK